MMIPTMRQLTLQYAIREFINDTSSAESTGICIDGRVDHRGGSALAIWSAAALEFPFQIWWRFTLGVGGVRVHRVHFPSKLYREGCLGSCLFRVVGRVATALSRALD